jgi:hypothetical protein
MKFTRDYKLNLCSPDSDGRLDYTTSVILLNKYSRGDKKLIKSALSPSIRKGKLSPKEMDAYNLIIHELTHYLDLTTTIWGAEFLLRRNAALSTIIEKGRDSVSVAMLNVAEILMHKEFDHVYHEVKLENLLLKHTLQYSEQHGTVVIVHLNVNGALAAETSVSMLSILEANAISNEFEGEFKWVSCTIGRLEKFQEDRIEAKFSQLLSDSSRLEYNIIHILVATHFSEHSLRHRLRFVSVLCELALNISSDRLSVLANKINDRMLNKYLGDALCNDLCRGMSRQVVTFYLVLMVYDYIKHVNLSVEEVAALLEEAPSRLIADTLDAFEVEFPPSEDISSFEYAFTLRLLRQQRSKFLLPGFVSSASFNRRLRQKMLSTSSMYKKLRLPDILLDDHTKIRLPTRLNANVEGHWSDIYEECSLLNEFVEDPEVMKKFHMKPGLYGPMQTRRAIHAQQLQELED